MKNSLPSLVLALALALALGILLSVPPARATSWPAWRGDLIGSGITTETNLPLTWSKEQNVRWRIALPEAGNSTPVVLGDRVFVTQAVTAEKWRGLMCFSLKDGKLLWKNGLSYDKEERTHRTNPYCSSSAATDGEIVAAAYGSAGIAVYDLDGKELWRRDLGPLDHEWGAASSPVLHGSLVIHYHGPGKGARLVAMDKKTGEIVWNFDEPQWVTGERTDGFQGRDDGIIGSFSTPILMKSTGREELIMSFPMEIKAFDPKTGQVLWTCGGLNPLVYTSPVAGDGMVLAMGGYRGNSVAVKTGGSGDVTQTHRLWQEVRHNGGIGTGVVKGDHYYYHDSGGIAYCLEMKTGKTVWRDRLPGAGKSWGSFVLAGDRIYTLSQAGDSVVFRASPEKLEILGQGDVGEQTNSSLVPVKNAFLLRTHDALWLIGAKE